MYLWTDTNIFYKFLINFSKLNKLKEIPWTSFSIWSSGLQCIKTSLILHLLLIQCVYKRPVYDWTWRKTILDQFLPLLSIKDQTGGKKQMEFPEIRGIYIAILSSSLIYHGILGTISSYMNEDRVRTDWDIYVFGVFICKEILLNLKFWVFVKSSDFLTHILWNPKCRPWIFQAMNSVTTNLGLKY